ncbi:MAG TPA: hypothetical protein ENJ37_00905 [Deltaproteobacteria bacterium]|nr:hypothetical protein [Deltaproteobacteria bacterium]
MLKELTAMEHFREHVCAAMERQGVEASETTEYYLTSLLAGFVESARLPDEPLALTYVKALSSDAALRRTLLRHLGDYALFVSGFFSDSLNRKVIDVDYYITMGTTSYGHLAAMSPGGREAEPLAGTFRELESKFTSFMDVLGEVSERSGLQSASDVLRIYERWLRTGSRRSERLLKELGIEPSLSARPTLQ